jgi:hypothetical protein
MGRMLGSTLTSALPSARSRSTSPAIASAPGAVQLEIDPTCTMPVRAGSTRASSSSVHRQSAAPRTWKP